ncbi:hypothetical protein [Isoptericola cucumis]|uniref:hypothetical protein n=1 Tax=Isoptericola cucumis TaxID=1776856 RepID=UPI00166AA154
MDRQLLYGLVVEAPFDLHQDRRDGGARPADVVVTTGPGTDQRTVPTGREILHHAVADDPWYTAWDLGADGHLLRFHGACDFEVSADLRDVVLRESDGVDPGLSRVLTTGGMLAFQLALRGEIVLHASAVEDDEGVLAFVGYSGMGKSTMATLMCADGAALVTDDVLRLDRDGDGFAARLGATEVRLRKGADTLVDRFAGRAPGRRVSADARHVLQLGAGARDGRRLRAIVVPRPDRGGGDLAVCRRTGTAALLELLHYPRLHGWRDARLQSEQLGHMADVARGVPVLVADVPWGPPFGPTLGARLAEAVSRAVAPSSDPALVGADVPAR